MYRTQWWSMNSATAAAPHIMRMVNDKPACSCRRWDTGERSLSDSCDSCCRCMCRRLRYKSFSALTQYWQKRRQIPTFHADFHSLPTISGYWNTHSLIFLPCSTHSILYLDIDGRYLYYVFIWKCEKNKTKYKRMPFYWWKPVVTFVTRSEPCGL